MASRAAATSLIGGHTARRDFEQPRLGSWAEVEGLCAAGTHKVATIDADQWQRGRRMRIASATRSGDAIWFVSQNVLGWPLHAVPTTLLAMPAANGSY